MLGHKEINRHALVNQSCYRIGIIWAGQNDTSLIFCPLDDGLVWFCIGAQNNAGCSDLNREKLRLKAVTDDDHVMLCHIIHHSFWCVCRDGNTSFVKGTADISADYLCFQHLDDIFIRSLCFGYDSVVVHIHIGCCDVGNGDDTFQHTLLIGDTQGAGFVFLHGAVRLLDGNFAVHTRNFLDFHIRNTGTDIGKVLWTVHSKIGQSKSSFLAHFARTFWSIGLAGHLSF